MADKLVMMYWDCSSCDSRGIEGTKRECPHCGNPRGKDVKFYMKSGKVRYLNEEESKTKGKGEDWLCSYCETLNSALSDNCQSCGHPRDEDSQSYSTIEQRRSKEEEEGYRLAQEFIDKDKGNTDIGSFGRSPNYNNQRPNNSLTRFLPMLILPLLLVMCIILGIKACSPKTSTFQVNEVTWETYQKVEVYKTFHESDWTVPAGGRVTSTRSEIYDYEKVLDHYEDVQKSRQVKVFDHNETKKEYIDNGDGTATEKTYEVPVYRYDTEYYTEKEPVYRKEPIYKTKYYYDIDRWTVDDVLKLKGTKGIDEIKYAEVKETDKKRMGSRGIGYSCVMTFLDDDKKKNEKKTFSISEEIYNKLEKDKKVMCKYWGDTIQEVLE